MGRYLNPKTVTKVKCGLFDEFHYRAVSVDLSNQKSIEMTISLIKEEGNELTSIETSRLTVPLDLLKE